MPPIALMWFREPLSLDHFLVIKPNFNRRTFSCPNKIKPIIPIAKSYFLCLPITTPIRLITVLNSFSTQHLLDIRQRHPFRNSLKIIFVDRVRKKANPKDDPTSQKKNQAD